MNDGERHIVTKGSPDSILDAAASKNHIFQFGLFSYDLMSPAFACCGAAAVNMFSTEMG
jgi:hypothetical protein